MRSHLFLTEQILRDAEDSPLPNCRVLRTLDDGRLAIHAHASVEIPPAVEVIRDGHAGEWEWEDLAVTHPALYEALCRTERDTEAGTVVEYRPPHYWTDDQPSSE